MQVKPGTKVSLKDFDPDETGSFESAKEVEDLLKKQLDEIVHLQRLLYAENRRALLVILQGMDTSGKDGTISHVMSGMSPLGVQVNAFKVPNEEELHHDYLWRVHQRMPRQGYIGIFNRSQYEDVLVVRVHELVPKKVWRTRYRQINQFEKIMVDNGTAILKFFLHISKAEQKKRLEERLKDPTRHWKFSLKDVEERSYWSKYRKAYETALTKCSTEWAPWHIVPANKKWYRNLLVAKTIVQTLRGFHTEYPQPSVDISKIVIK
ncbi:MAG TPA: polyphosphate kinase 2 family protein [Gemmataceae bacterium]|jgi:PPK2 family polyphosphate:nucleotide phosphotransferase|nr:polyphosphate kinase 2 family protein [Gemmataceae bacterium]